MEIGENGWKCVEMGGNEVNKVEMGGNWWKLVEIGGNRWFLMVAGLLGLAHAGLVNITYRRNCLGLVCGFPRHLK